MHVRWIPVIALMLTTAAACGGLLLGDVAQSAAETATAMAAALLALWPLYAMPISLSVASRNRAPAALLEAVMVAASAMLAVWFMAEALTALRLLAILLLLLLIVQLLLGFGINRVSLTIGLVLAMLAPVWSAPIEAAASSGRLATLAVLANPLSALASACGCDYLRSLWFYQHSNIGASQFAYPAYGSSLLSCAGLLGALAALSLCLDAQAAQNNGLSQVNHLLSEKSL